MSFSEAIKQNYQANNEARRIPVEEWDCTIYVFPMTVGQMTDINKAGTTPFDLCIKTLEVRAKNEDGSRMFTPNDIDELRKFGIGKFGTEKIIEVASKINEDINGTVDEGKSQSSTDSSS